MALNTAASALRCSSIDAVPFVLFGLRQHLEHDA
jgi:hypothetical protein